MTEQELKTLKPGKSYVKFAGGKYKFAGRYPKGHLLRNAHILIYDEPPSDHTDSVLISSCKIFQSPNHE